MKQAVSMLILIAAMLVLPVYAKTPSIQAFEPGSMSEIVAAKKGAPFVLVLWSLDCEYCKASLEALRQEQAKRKNLRVVTLATDSIADPEAVVLIGKKLVSLGMTANAYAFGEAPPEQLRYAVDPKWRGELPRSYWFNARGESVAHSGLITPALIAKLYGAK